MENRYRLPFFLQIFSRKKSPRPDPPTLVFFCSLAFFVLRLFWGWSKDFEGLVHWHRAKPSFFSVPPPKKELEGQCDCSLSGKKKFQGRTNPAFSKPCLFLSDTRHFRHFRRFWGSEEPNPCFQWVECKFVIFAVFVKTAPFWQGTKTRFNKNTVCVTPIKNSININFLVRISRGHS